MRTGLERLLGGEAFSRAPFTMARLKAAHPRGGNGTSRVSRCSRNLDSRVGRAGGKDFQSLENFSDSRRLG